MTVRWGPLLVAVGVLVGPVPGAGQASVTPVWRVGIGAGWVQRATLDRLASTQGYTGWGAPLAIELERAGARSIHEMTFRLSSLALSARNEGPSGADELAVALRYGYEGRVAQGGSRAWYVGGAWVTTAFLRAYSYGGGEVWDGHSGLAARGRVVQRLGSGRAVDMAASFGLLGWSMRPPYSVEDNTTLVLHERPSRIVTELGRLTTAWTRPSAALRVRLTAPLWGALVARAGVRLEWSHDRDPRPATTAGSGIDLTLTYRFGGDRG